MASSKYMMKDVLILMHHLSLLHSPPLLIAPTTYKAPNPNKFPEMSFESVSKTIFEKAVVSV